ncbi:hypothetical protein DER46DRAFT_51586 [Fusarium sp. MPI-SDFR-AT-0072]|nr:hypothetical protein DER46DRAFT_51586 [Fusarium sp. MPI-SDFR-AT-0072]
MGNGLPLELDIFFHVLYDIPTRKLRASIKFHIYFFGSRIGIWYYRYQESTMERQQFHISLNLAYLCPLCILATLGRSEFDHRVLGHHHGLHQGSIWRAPASTYCSNTIIVAGLSRNLIKKKIKKKYRSNELYEVDVQALGNGQAGPVHQKDLFSSFFTRMFIPPWYIVRRLSPIPHSSWTRRTVSPEITNRPSNRASIYTKFGTCPNLHHRKSVCTFRTKKSELNSELGLHCRVRQFGGLLGNKYTRSNQQIGLIENWWQRGRISISLQKNKRKTSFIP